MKSGEQAKVYSEAYLWYNYIVTQVIDFCKNLIYNCYCIPAEGLSVAWVTLSN